MSRHLDLHVSAPYCHHQNGQIERAMQTVLDKTRTLLAASQAPFKYWDYALTFATFLIQRTPNSNNNKTPFEILTGTAPDISKMVHFFAPGVYHLTKEERSGTWDYKAKPCRMLGYDDLSRDCYRILTVPEGKILSRKDCIWDNALSQYSLAEIIDSTERRADLLEFSDQDVEVIDGRLVGDEIAPYFGLTPDEYQAQQDQDEVDQISARQGASTAEYYGMSAAEFQELVERDKNNAHAVMECYINDFALTVHAPLALPPDPKSYEDAVAQWDGAEWVKAVDKELENFNSRGIAATADQTGKAMKTKLVLKYMYTETYELKRKARLVVCGYSQIKGVDFQETYAPTTNNIITSIVCQICTAKGLFMATFDVTAAFLEGTADCKMYARLPKCISPTMERVEIIGNWYGLKQGPKIWNDQLNAILLELDFIRCPVHPCLYSRTRVGVFIILGVHVDDGLMGCSHDQEFDVFLAEFKQHVRQATITRHVQKYTGTTMAVSHEEHYVRLSHSVYIGQKFKDIEVPRRVQHIPMDPAVNLRRAEANPDNESLLSDTGTFRFIADRARPDILVACGELATGGDKSPSDLHLLTSQRVKEYLVCHPDLYIQLGGLGKLVIFGYSDASYITDGNAKSRLGGCVFMNYSSGAIFSFSRNDTIRNVLKQLMSALSHSSTEAEIKALDVLILELLHILDVTRFAAGDQSLPIKIFCDNKAAAQMFATLKSNNRVKHLNMRIQFIRELIQEGIIAIHFVPTKHNVADMLTKALPRIQFEYLRTILMLGHGGKEPGVPSWDQQVEVHSALIAESF